jgi:ABC-type multidrug transport system ATPase subunit
MIPASEGTIQRTDSWGISTIDMALYPSLTAAEHILFGARLRGVKSEPNGLLTRVGLGDAEDVLASNMSTGMRARLKLALAIHHKPNLLFLDEPTAALDVSGREIVESITAEVSENGAVVLATNDKQDMRMATHELRLA